jgi:hypothetical protein
MDSSTEIQRGEVVDDEGLKVAFGIGEPGAGRRAATLSPRSSAGCPSHGRDLRTDCRTCLVLIEGVEFLKAAGGKGKLSA